MRSLTDQPNTHTHIHTVTQRYPVATADVNWSDTVRSVWCRACFAWQHLRQACVSVYIYVHMTLCVYVRVQGWGIGAIIFLLSSLKLCSTFLKDTVYRCFRSDPYSLTPEPCRKAQERGYRSFDATEFQEWYMNMRKYSYMPQEGINRGKEMYC